MGELFSVYWPVIVIFFGLQGLLLQRNGGLCWNPIVVAVGVYFLGRNLDWFEWEIGQLWPAVVIWIGICMLFRGNRPKRTDRQADHGADGWNSVTPPPVPPNPFQHHGPPPAPPLTDDPAASFTNANGAPVNDPAAYSDERERQSHAQERQQHSDPYRQERDQYRQHYRDERHAHHHGRHWHKDHWKDRWHEGKQSHSRFIGDIFLGNDYWELRPMNISMFIGDTTIDLTKAQIPSGETKLYISSFIGDVKVFVPNDANIGVQVVSSCLIGDVSILDQKRGGLFNQTTVETLSYQDTEKKVVLVVSSFIGDVRVTKVG
ncbi:cell wall-active antibiotics response protein LiaF [Cohnella faecalis]|uniref:cell wall-active antibiotics response protein LiaF n=1 Tax=Cohnella faecalis TaxID=2315694 RepID=UPI00398987D8